MIHRLSKCMPRFILFVLLGIVLNTIVIYASAYFLQDKEYVRHESAQMAWIGQAPAGFPPRPMRVDEWTGFGTRHFFAYATEPIVVQGNFSVLQYEQWYVEAGWPLHGCSGGHFLVIGEGINGLKIVSQFSAQALVLGQAQPGNVVLLPFRIEFVPFGIGAGFYALVICLTVQLWSKARGLLRDRRGLCPACAYPVGDSAVCTECGGKVIPARMKLS